MKTGVIIIFHNYEKVIDKYFFIDHANKVKDIQICLVNNNSKDNTYNLLKEISEACENVSVVNIKKAKSEISAVRAGARYMFNVFNFKCLGYFSNLHDYDVNGLLKAIIDNQNAILNYDSYRWNAKEIRQTLFKSLYSMNDYLKEINEYVSFLEKSHKYG